MKSFVRKAVLPAYSDAKGLQLEDSLFFSSHTHIFSHQSTQFSLFTSVEGTVRCFSIIGERALACTDERVYMMRRETFIGSIKRQATSIDATEKHFVIGVNNYIEVWEIPQKYSFIQFNRVYKGIGHSRDIISVKIVGKSEVLSASSDGTIRHYNWETKETRVVAKAVGLPVGFSLSNTNLTFISDSGHITFCDINRTSNKEEERIDVNGKIVCCAADSDYLIVAVLEENVEKKKEEPASHFHSPPPPKKITYDAERTRLSFYKGKDEVYRGEISGSVYELAISKQFATGTFAVRGSNGSGYVGVYSPTIGSFLSSIELPQIINFSLSEKGLVVASCRDGKVRIYNNQACKMVLYDEKAIGEIQDAHSVRNSCIVVRKTGYVSVFNINNGFCYRSFKFKTIERQEVYSHSCVNEDGDILFYSDEETLSVIDLQRRKLIDEKKCDTPLTNLCYSNSHIYYADMTSRIVKQNPYTNSIHSIPTESIPTAFKVTNGKVLIAVNGSILVYDTDLNFIASFAASLEGRSRDEVYSKPKAVEQIAANSSFVVCGGRANQIKIIAYGSKKLLWKNEVFQVIRPSMHSDWENYKGRLGRESEKEYNKERYIDIRRIEAMDGRLFILLREGLQIYEHDIREFYPLELQVNSTPEFIESCIEQGLESEALLGAITSGNYSLIRKSILTLTRPRETVRAIPSTYASLLLDYVMDILREDYRNQTLLEMVKWVCIEHRVGDALQAYIIQESVKEDYALLTEVYHLSRCASRKAQTKQ